jgi:hypothetical protein
MQGDPGKTGGMARYAPWWALEILGVTMMTALLVTMAWFAAAVAVALWLLGADAAWPFALVALGVANAVASLATGLWLKRRVWRLPLDVGWRKLRDGAGESKSLGGL